MDALLTEARPVRLLRTPRRARALAVAATTALAALAACGTATDETPSERPSAAEVPTVPEMGHVHGLGTNPEDGAAYVATHTGVFRVAEGGEPVRVADRHQDTMGFVVVGPDRFLGSGHPAPAEADLPSHLGLIETTDAAESWQSLSLAGEADFHALDAGPARVFGYDALSGRVLATTDRQSWQELGTAEVLDLAADPDGPDRVLATTPRGELVEYVVGEGSRRLPGAPPVGFVDWPRPDLLAGVDAEGRVHVSRDSGASWAAAGEAQGAPQAFDAGEDVWLLATGQVVLRSVDEGRSWAPLVRLG